MGHHLKQLFHWPKVNAYTRVKGAEELAGKGMLTLKTANQWCHLHTSDKATKTMSNFTSQSYGELQLSAYPG